MLDRCFLILLKIKIIKIFNSNVPCEERYLFSNLMKASRLSQICGLFFRIYGKQSMFSLDREIDFGFSGAK